MSQEDLEKVGECMRNAGKVLPYSQLKVMYDQHVREVNSLPDWLIMNNISSMDAVSALYTCMASDRAMDLCVDSGLFDNLTESVGLALWQVLTSFDLLAQGRRYNLYMYDSEQFAVFDQTKQGWRMIVTKPEKSRSIIGSNRMLISTLISRIFVSRELFIGANVPGDITRDADLYELKIINRGRAEVYSYDEVSDDVTINGDVVTGLYISELAEKLYRIPDYRTETRQWVAENVN